MGGCDKGETEKEIFKNSEGECAGDSQRETQVGLSG